MFIGLSHAGMQQTGGGGKGYEFANTKHQVSVTLSTYKVLLPGGVVHCDNCQSCQQW